MNENKRFKIKLSDIGELMDCDTQSILAVSSIANELIPLCNLLNKLNNENEQLKKEIVECKNNEKQLSISFMGYKMQLIEVLQQNYDYAYGQRQKNLDNSIVARSYELLYQTIDIIAETMNVDIERFPNDDVE